eukprot:gene5499-6054_t
MKMQSQVMLVLFSRAMERVACAEVCGDIPEAMMVKLCAAGRGAGEMTDMKNGLLKEKRRVKVASDDDSTAVRRGRRGDDVSLRQGEDVVTLSPKPVGRRKVSGSGVGLWASTLSLSSSLSSWRLKDSRWRSKRAMSVVPVTNVQRGDVGGSVGMVEVASDIEGGVAVDQGVSADPGEGMDVLADIEAFLGSA